MKISALVIISLALFCGYASAQAPGQLENIDVDSLLANARYVRTQIQCVLNQGKCDKTGRDLKGKFGGVQSLSLDENFKHFLCPSFERNYWKKARVSRENLLPEVLQRDCSKCSPIQKVNANKIVNFMRTNHAADWVTINGIYG